MPRSSRKSNYHLRHHAVDPLLTYDGIDKNPLVYIADDDDDDRTSFLTLAELHSDLWKIDQENEKIYLDQDQVYRFTDEEEKALVKDRLHPLTVFYQLTRSERTVIDSLFEKVGKTDGGLSMETDHD